MGLFVRKDKTVSSDGPQFSISSQQTILIVGLGNVGKEYEGTRHNIGFTCVDTFAEQQGFPKWSEKRDLKCYIAQAQIAGKNVVIIKPNTYMNESGQAVHAIQSYYKIPSTSTLVIHDELDINFGQIRTQVGGGSAGNNGIKSIIGHCGEDFGRIRIGIKNEFLANMDSADFVLAKFSGEERRLMPSLIREALSLLTEYTSSGTINTETRNFII